MRAYFVPSELMQAIGNISNRIPLYGTIPSNSIYIDVQKFEHDLELAFYVNGSRIWTVRFSDKA